METKMSELEQLEAQVEAILFAMGESVEIEKIAKGIKRDVKTTRKVIQKLMEKYNQQNSGLKIIPLENSYQMCTKPEYYDALIRVASQPKRQVMTAVLLETLSIIAYKQPVTKVEIEKIRGVKSDHAVNKLVEYELVEEVGRLDAPGRPLLFGTTEEFLRRFGLPSIEQLPPIDQEKVQTFKLEAIKEADEKLNLNESARDADRKKETDKE